MCANYHFSNIIGVSDAITEVFALMGKVGWAMPTLQLDTNAIQFADVLFSGELSADNESELFGVGHRE
jgi:hypothetical protein